MFFQASLRMWAILLGEEVGGSSVEGRSCVRRDLVDGKKSFASFIPKKPSNAIACLTSTVLQ